MRSAFRIIALSLIILLTLSAAGSFAQAPAKKKKPRTLRESARKSMHSRDSLFQALNKSDTSMNNLLQKFSQYTSSFNQINNALAEGLDTSDIGEQVPSVIKRIAKIKQLANTRKSSTLRYLTVLRDNLDHLQDQMDGWQGDLDDINTKLVQNQHDILRFKSDTLLANAIPTDSALRDAFFDRRAELGDLWRKTDSANRTALYKLNLLQNKVATSYTSILDATDVIDSKIRRFAARAMTGEFGPIWTTDNQYN